MESAHLGLFSARQCELHRARIAAQWWGSLVLIPNARRAWGEEGGEAPRASGCPRSTCTRMCASQRAHHKTCASHVRVKRDRPGDRRPGDRVMTLRTTERLLWHWGGHTAEPESAPCRRFLMAKIGCCFLRHGGRGRRAKGRPALLVNLVRNMAEDLI